MDILFLVMGGAILVVMLALMVENWKGVVAFSVFGIILFVLASYAIYISAITFFAVSLISYMDNSSKGSASIGNALFLGAKVAIVILIVAEALGWLGGVFTGSTGSCGRYRPSGC
ncbi:hypothetical protein VHA01S_030_00450 [Vibrio halioticoli NBRC 102217]|uniref:Uncharacterized protein n=1 Tax=Vibrio halioticoli NBRC 102217 TaxID=1219072 RepID=V5HLA8_9VIBR|nr:hypothetical protein [Vibrio halioticoli]GAD89970.1 hypothetical protein VHA01S_030_00450 [Vibrio halioticoli NBRC 102217]